MTPVYRHALALCVFALSLITGIPRAYAALTPAQSESDLQNKILLRRNINAALQQTPSPEPPSVAPPGLPDPGGQRFLIHHIFLDSGEHPQYDKKLSPVIQQYEGTRMGGSEIFSLLRDTTSILASEGLVTSVVVVVPSNLRHGELGLRIRWGYVAGWLADGQPVTTGRDGLMLAQALPAAAGRLLNMRDIDQALETLNNDGQSARIDVQPSATAGYSWLNVTRLKKDRLSLFASVDNAGHGHSARENLYRYSAGATLSNVFAGVDTLSLTANTHHIRRDEGNADYYAGLSYALPFGYNILSVQGSYSAYRKPVKGYYGDYLSKGSAGIMGGRLTRTLYRDQNSTLSFFGGLQYRRGRNYLAGEYIDVSSRPYTTLSAGAQYVTSLAGGRFYSDLAWNRGLSWWSGDAGARNDNAPVMVRYLTFNSSWNRSFELARQPFSWSSNLSGQYSPDTLLNDFRLAVGDDYTVRGFKGDPFLADSGASLNNTLNLPGLTHGAFMLTPFLGLDAAWLRDAQGGTTTLLGSAAGLNAQYRALSGSVAIEVPLHDDRGSAQDTDNWVITFSTRVSL
jgi:hemolysin activation/secretion protein